jgi:hypothetical protein
MKVDIPEVPPPDTAQGLYTKDRLINYSIDCMIAVHTAYLSREKAELAAIKELANIARGD